VIDRQIILRETVVSVIINVVLSIGFFLFFFGLSGAVRFEDLGPDFLPQSFMIALMGTLMPALILSRKRGWPVGPVVVRSLLIAVTSAVVAGGGAYAICAANAGGTIEHLPALVIKAVYGSVLSAIVTPIASAALLRSAVHRDLG
jgi:multisubunit Na+/H+ antiporter MnhG subunit